MACDFSAAPLGHLLNGVRPLEFRGTTFSAVLLAWHQGAIGDLELQRMPPARLSIETFNAVQSLAHEHRMALQLPRHKFTTDEYEQMAVSGIIKEDDRVELLDGDIVEMRPIGLPHVRCVNRLNMLFAPRLVGHAIVQIQSSLKLDSYWQPEPDVAVLRLREDDYVSGLATGADVLLVIEVMDSSRAYDRVKLPAYARSGIPEVWFVDLNDQVLLSHRQSVAGEYRLVQAFRTGDSVTPQALAGYEFEVGSILG